MSEDNFVVNYEEGRKGELYVQAHLSDLISSFVSNISDTSTEKTEGKDFIASIVNPDTGEVADAKVEVKTVRGFLFRTNDNEEETGTIGFELWKSKRRKTPGWLLQMLKPDGRTSFRPDMLVFLLVAYDRPFVSVAFKNVPALFERLDQLANESGLNPNEIPVGDQAIGFTIPSLIENMWMIPLGKLADLAHVIMIGEQPRLRPDIKTPEHSCLMSTQRKRYDYLNSLATGSIQHDDHFIFEGSKAAQTIAIVNRNLDILEHINFDHFEQLKYMNRTGTFARLWRGLYLFMLSCEYPEREYKGDRYYPIAYQTISRWGSCNEINAQAYYWFVVIKHLLEFGLLKHYRPHTKSTNPIDMKVNKNNPYPKSVEYYCPVVLTRDALLEADCIAQNYKRNKRRTSTTSRAAMEIQSGPEVAGKAFQDKRTLTKQDRYVRDVAVKLLDTEISKHDYITVDDYFNKLWKTIARVQKLKPIDAARSTDDQKAKQRYEKYWSSFNRLKTERKDFIRQMKIYKMGLVTRRDKYWLGDIPYGTNIITYKGVPSCYTRQFWEASLKDRESRNKKRREKRRATQPTKTT